MRIIVKIAAKMTHPHVLVNNPPPRNWVRLLAITSTPWLGVSQGSPGQKQSELFWQDGPAPEPPAAEDDAHHDHPFTRTGESRQSTGGCQRITDWPFDQK
jgi:hypothetical protein